MQPQRDPREEQTQPYQPSENPQDQPRERVYRDELAFPRQETRQDQGGAEDNEVARGQASVPDTPPQMSQPGTPSTTSGTVKEPDQSLWGDGAAEIYEERWREVQLHFVDDPRRATDEAEALVDELSDALASALATQRQGLAQWHAVDTSDTEKMRVTLTRYHDLFERLLHV